MISRKKLIEVALPLDSINDASAYDKMPGIGPHPKGIHPWWARLPLPCARAVLFASLIDDPSENPEFANRTEREQNEERDRLFQVIRAMTQKRVHDKPEVFELAYDEILASCHGELPTIVDPFCGGGSIPLEAQRLGLNTQASDLNPVAVLITKAMIEVIPRFANRAPVNPKARADRMARQDWPRALGLAEDVRYYSEWVLERARAQVSQFYPNVKLPLNLGGEATVIAWLWARTVVCPNPACRLRVPLVRSFKLSGKKGREAWVEPIINDEKKIVRFEVRHKGSPPAGTLKARKGANCPSPSCQRPIPFTYIKSEGCAGNIKPQLMAIAAEGKRGKVYLSPSEEHETIAGQPRPLWMPDTELPDKALGFRIQAYGLTRHSDLFTQRQLAAMTTLADLMNEVREQVLEDAKGADGWPLDLDLPLKDNGVGPVAYTDAVTLFLAFALDRCSDFNNSLCRWSQSNEKVMGLFGAQRISMVWDFAEANILADSVGGWSTCSAYVADCIEVILGSHTQTGKVRQLDAASATLSNGTLLVSTDPPYYDNIGYADLSDFFYIWLRHSVFSIYPDVCSTLLVPKTPELVAAPERFDNDQEAAKDHFENGFRRAFTLLKSKLDPRFPMTVYYAFKQADETESDEGNRANTTNLNLTTGWETLLEALISAGFQITGTWPVRASQQWRMRSMGSNALASYIVLACRPRSESAALATRREFLNSLKSELPEALKKLQHGNIAPVDLAQAAIGPGMAVFSRYSKVVESDGTPMRVRTALQLINQTLDEGLAEQESEYDAETRWAVAWYEQFGMSEGAYGTAEILSKAKNTSVSGMDEAGITSSRAGKVRLLRRDELPEEWDPRDDRRLTIWEITQHLIHTLLDRGSEQSTADLLRKVGALGETARDLSYRLYTTSERKGWTQEALAYNSLVVAWPEIKRLASSPSEPQAVPLPMR